MHSGKSRIYRATDGITFLGWRIFPDRLRLIRANVVRFRRRLAGLARGFKDGELDWEELRERLRAWIAHAAHGDTWRLRRRIFSGYNFGPRSAV